MGLFISPRVREKLKSKHNVTEAQILQCFANRVGRQLVDTRPEHQTNPPTQWFIAETDYGIKLKVCFMFDPESKMVEIKSAFPPNEKEIEIYNRFGM